MNKQIFKNRIFLGIISIALALILGFIIIPLFNRTINAQVEIIRANTDIPQGEVITLDKLVKVKIGGYNLPTSVIKDSDSLVGKYAKVDILKDDYITSGKIEDINESKNKDFYSLDKENLAVSISLKNLSSGLSGKIQKEDIVSIIGLKDEDNPVIIDELKYVKVLSVVTNKGIDAETEEEIAENIILMGNPIQIEKIAEYELLGEIHIALVSRGDPKEAEKLLEIQKENLLNNLPKFEEGEDEEPVS